jgi:hypothetical protein
MSWSNTFSRPRQRRTPSATGTLLARHIQDELEDWIMFMLLPGDKEEA